MNRIIAITTALLVATSSAAVAQSSSAEPANLKAAVTVDGSLVTLGDLVSNAGKLADVAVFQAPDLGRSGKVSADRVIDAARSHGLDVAQSDFSKVTVTRRSRTVTEADIRTALMNETKESPLGQHSDEIEILFSEPITTVHLPASDIGGIDIQNLAIAPRGGRFSATVTINRPNGDVTPLLPVQGTIQAMMHVPVLAKRMARGEVLTPSAFVFERRPHTQVPRDAAELEESIGMAVGKAMSPGAVIKHSDLVQPILVGRNEQVTMILTVGRLRITARGRALAEGGKSDTVSVLNMDSNRKINATVVGDGIVLVEGKDRPIQIAQNLAFSSQGNQ